MAAGKAVTFEGLEDAAGGAVGAVEIDGVTLPKGEPVEGLSAEQVERLQELPGHRFTVGAGKDEKLTGDALEARIAELGLEGLSNATADEKRAAVAEAEQAGGS